MTRITRASKHNAGHTESPTAEARRRKARKAQRQASRKNRR